MPKVIDPLITAKTFPPIEAEEEEGETVFKYIDTASSRAEIGSSRKSWARKKLQSWGWVERGPTSWISSPRHP